MVFPSAGDPSSTFLASSVRSSISIRGSWRSFHEERPSCGSIGFIESGASPARWGRTPDSALNLAPCCMFETAVDNCGQATKGAGWMSWHREATKDAVACDKPREAGKQALIRGFPNRETGLATSQSLLPECIG